MESNNPHLLGDSQEIEAATRLSRLMACFIDYLIWFAPFPLIIFPCIGPILMLVAWLAIVVTQVWMLVTRAQTIGKKAMGIYVMRVDGQIPNIGWLLVREFAIPVLTTVMRFIGQSNQNTFGVVINALAVILWLTDVLFIFGPTRQCLHDFLADTHVVKA
jgi:uncharacterized RDD family membrane protein YckC